MNFVGLPLATLIPLGALVATLTIGLYILKMRRRAVAVPFARIWARVVKDQDATSLFSQLKRLMSLLMQLALLALLLIALGDPRVAAKVLTGRNVVVLLDASASMKATDVGPSRLEEAKRRVSTLARGLSGADRMLVAQMDAAVTPLSTLTGDVAEIDTALKTVHGTDARADFPRALRFATDTLRGLTLPEIIVVSDGVLGEAHDGLGDVGLGDAKLSFEPLGTEGKNAAITQFSVRRYPLDKSRYEVMLEVTNTSAEPMEIELSLVGDGDPVDVTKLRLAASERLPRFYPNLSGASRTLEATLRNADGSRDDLPADDHAYALLPERRRVKVQCVTEGNTYLEAALLLDEYLDVTTVGPEAYPSPGKFDVTIFDGPPATKKPWLEGSGSALYLDPSGDGSPVKIGAELDDVGFDEWDKKSPLLRWMVMDTINVGLAHELEVTKDDRAVGSVVESNKKRAILVSGRRDGHRFVALGFDPRRSDIVLRIAWPLFLLNTINDFIEEDTRYLSSYRTGDVWQLPAPVGAGSVRLVGPCPGPGKGKDLEAGCDEQALGGRTLTVEDGRAVVLGQDAGFYRLIAGAGPTEASSFFAANLSDVAESTIAPKKELLVAGKPAVAVSGFTFGVRREVWIYLLLIVILLTTFEWITYHRRLTV